jgi:hypothetical protein
LGVGAQSTVCRAGTLAKLFFVDLVVGRLR